MSAHHENGNRRAKGIGAPAGALEKTVEFESDAVEDMAPNALIVPSKHDPEALDAHVEAGHELIAVDGKKPVASGWRTALPLAREQAERRLLAGRNVGVRLRDVDLVLDVDPRNFAENDDPLTRLVRDFDLRDAPFVVTGGGGKHLYFRKPAEVAVVNELDAYRGVEFKSLGRQVVAAGSVHPETGRLYALDDDVLRMELSEAPEASEKLLRAIEKLSVGASENRSGEITAEQLARLLSKLDVMAYNGRHDEWLKVMMASHHGTAGEGVDEFVAWSTSDPDYAGDEARIRERWNSLDTRRGGVTLKTLLRALVDAGNGAWIEEVLRSAPEDDFDDVPEMPRSMGDLALARMNRNHFTVLHGGKYLVGRESKHPTLGHVAVDWFSAGAISAHFDSRTVEVEDGKQKALGSWWVKHPRRRQYEGVVFDPSPKRTHTSLYNLWRGWAVEPKAGDWSLLKRLLKDVLCRGDAESFDYVLRWAAFMVQKPDMPAEVALVFKGSKGAGKGTFARALKSLAGMHGKQVAQAEHFVGRFNEHLMDCVLLFVDEGYWAGDPKAAGALKNLITEPVLSFEPKGRPIVSGPNMLHVVIASNEDWIVPASADERRFAVFEADTEARKRLPSGFFDTLNAQMANGGLAAMLHDLQNLDLGDWHPRMAIPNTQALIEQKVQAFRREPLSFWWFRTLEAGGDGLTLDEDVWAVRQVDVGPNGKEELVAEVCAVAKGMNRTAQFSKKAVAQFLKSVGVDVNAKDSRGVRVWRMPVLAEARVAFERHVGGALDWDGV
ncbi:DUF5906 domain-containing protein [Polymorphum gilvum]|uniref:Gp33 n=1 Tax=Polymorphum gilvum (strain LMG 25793 / CGMCC 1.9160 / SL003B-26A1) TaxID=991905 RepID=F2J5Q1_POLGS|nr:DUF5906 domain-containing protein [Polymorphum gilvum]ADZ70135.1 Gp33 [Polymorphum gilvum SL003B-26A1]